MTEITRAQRDLIANVVEAWCENLYETWQQVSPEYIDNEMPDAEEMFEDHGPGAVHVLRETDHDPETMDAGNWRAVEAAVECVVMGWDDGYENTEGVIAAAAALGLTRQYFLDGPTKGSQ
jgi:hypothetical protein